MKIEYYIETTLLKFLKTKKIDSIRVIDLIDEIGICKGTFYKYYQDKYHLLICSFQNHFYNGILNGAQTWESFLSRSMNSFKNSPSIIINAYFSENAGADEDEYYAYSADVFTHYVTDVLMAWLKNKCVETNEELIRKIKAIMPITLFVGLYGPLGGKNENKKQLAN